MESSQPAQPTHEPLAEIDINGSAAAGTSLSCELDDEEWQAHAPVYL